MEGPILLILTGEDCGKAADAALRYAQSTSGKLRVIQILTSDLYHYGHHDLVATRPTKRQFLLYVRDEVLKRGQAEIRALEETAHQLGVSLELQTMEAENYFSAALSELKKSAGVVFLPKQTKGLFPLFKRTLSGYLQKKIAGRVIPC